MGEGRGGERRIERPPSNELKALTRALTKSLIPAIRYGAHKKEKTTTIGRAWVIALQRGGEN